MTYPFDTMAIKKSELLPIIRQVMPDFCFEDVASADQQQAISHEVATVIQDASKNDLKQSNTIKEMQERIDFLESKLKDLESNSSQLIQKYDFIDIIFDTSSDSYAPDLVNAINLYRHVYIDQPNTDSHNNRAKRWIHLNTNYQDGSSSSRLIDLTSPLLGWAGARDKGYKK